MTDEQVELLAKALRYIGNQVCAPTFGHDATGGRVESLTEAVMGLTQAMEHVADTLEGIRSAIGDIHDSIETTAVLAESKRQA
jgi:hypothetical protein